MKCFTFISLILIADSQAEVNIKYVNDIIKSPIDERLYRGLVLPNQLRVLLISDPETDKSAAALSVGVGSLSDPDGLPGLAHFCEHMLFLGSEKYPNENEFMKFISEHGGENHNAFTHSDQTLYAFDVESKHFKGALDIFAQFFIRPLMSKDSVDREVNAVNSEFQLDNADDDIRFFQLLKSLSKNSHPFSKFYFGNKMSLVTLPQEKGIDVRRELLNFYEKFYSANVMILTVLGKESLEDLQKITVPIFSEIKNKNVLRPEWPDHPFGPDQVQSKTYIVPIDDFNELHITFPIPDLRKYYKSKPLMYISRLLSDTRHGSLMSILKSNDWALKISATNGTNPDGKGFDFFTISIVLTDEGIEKVNEIIILTFQYLNFLREFRDQKWIFEEYKKISEINFRFQDKQNPFDYVLQIAENSHNYDYPFEEVLSGPYLIEEYKPDLITMVLSDYLKPSNVHVSIIGRKFENITDKIEPWYGTKYKFEKISGRVIQNWQNCGVNIGFKLPAPNEFIPTNFKVLFKEKKHDRYKHPLIIHENNFTRIWYKQDDKFLLPKANLKFNFISPLTSSDPLNELLTVFLILMIELEIDDYAYPATLAGFSCDIVPTINGFILNINGFTDKLDIFLEEVLKKVTDFSVVLTLHQELLRHAYGKYLNFKNEESHLQFQDYFDPLLREKSWTADEVEQAWTQMNADDATKFLTRFFSNLFVECLIHGNIDEETANSLIEIMDRRLFFRIYQPLLPEELLGDRVVKLNDREYFLYKDKWELNESSLIGTYYQCGEASTENNVLVQVLNQIIKGPCFDVLRTEEQLGYVVQSASWKFQGVQGLIILIQSDKNPYFVDSRVENFLVRVRKIMDNMSEEEFEQNKQSLAAKISVKPINLAQLSEMFWNEIIGQEYNFDRAKTEVAYLRTITKTDLTKFFDEYIKQDGPKRRKLSVHIIPEARASQEADSTFLNNSVVGPQEIKDVNLFKESHEFYSPPESCVDIADFKIINLKYLYDSCSETNSALLEFMCRVFLD